MRITEFEEERRKPFEYKLATAYEEIDAAFEVCRNPSIAFSGGKDSLVMWHMIRTRHPEAAPWVIFGNTGVEYPESIRFARQLGREWGGDRFIEARPAKLEREGMKYEAQRETLDWLIKTGRIGDVLKKDGKLKKTEALEDMATPEMWADFRKRGLVWPIGTRMNYWYCVDQYGWPILGKAACRLNAHRINIDCFLRFSNTASADKSLLDYYELIGKVKISQMCCSILKKEPSDRVQRELGVDLVFLGMMGTESRRRMLSFCQNEYLYQVKCEWRPDGKQWRAHPMGIWTDEDVWEYIRRNNLPYSPLYDMYWTDAKGEKHYIKRNGCWGCATAITFSDNQIAMIRRTHPRLWETVMKKGMAEQLQRLRIARKNGQLSFMDVYTPEELIELRPCIFDSIDKIIWQDDTITEYDGELDAEADDGEYVEL